MATEKRRDFHVNVGKDKCAIVMIFDRTQINHFYIYPETLECFSDIHRRIITIKTKTKSISGTKSE